LGANSGSPELISLKQQAYLWKTFPPLLHTLRVPSCPLSPNWNNNNTNNKILWFSQLGTYIISIPPTPPSTTKNKKPHDQNFDKTTLCYCFPHIFLCLAWKNKTLRQQTHAHTN
jgi:hypothetical protein